MQVPFCALWGAGTQRPSSGASPSKPGPTPSRMIALSLAQPTNGRPPFEASWRASLPSTRAE